MTHRRIILRLALWALIMVAIMVGKGYFGG